MPFAALGPFFALTFGLAWGLGAIAMLFAHQVETIFGPMGYTNPLFILIVYAPGLAGIFLVCRYYGLAGWGPYLRRLTLLRMPVAWWAFLVLGIPAVKYLGAALKGTGADPFPFSPWYAVLPALATGLLVGPMEELGWRGVALPLLQRRFAPLWAGLILGTIWGLWHVPAFFLGGTPQSAWSLGPYVLGVLALSVILTPMFNAARGSILIAALFHFQMNNPLWPDAQPWENYLFALAAVAIVLLNRGAMLTRPGAVTEVLWPADALDHGPVQPGSLCQGPARRLFSPAVARIAANVATAGFLLTAVLQMLLALGVVPVTMAWGGTQPVLTTPLRIASLGAVVVLGLAAYVMRRRAGPHPSRPISVLAWVIAVLLAANTAGNFASQSMGEAVLFSPLSLVLAASCLLVASSRQPDRADKTFAPAGAAVNGPAANVAVDLSLTCGNQHGNQGASVST